MNPFHLYLYGPQLGPIESSFEAAQQRLELLPLLHFEPDGSFVWARDSGRQQVFGMLYDAGGQIQYSELQGTCQLEFWQQLLAAIGGEATHDFSVMRLPQRVLQDLQTFEAEQWSKTDRS